MAARKTWAELTAKERRAVYVGGALEAMMTAGALVDLSRRPASQIRGRKWAWVLSFVVQPFGPLSYFAFGRRTTRSDAPDR